MDFDTDTLSRYAANANRVFGAVATLGRTEYDRQMRNQFSDQLGNYPMAASQGEAPGDFQNRQLQALANLSRIPVGHNPLDMVKGVMEMRQMQNQMALMGVLSGKLGAGGGQEQAAPSSGQPSPNPISGMGGTAPDMNDPLNAPLNGQYTPMPGTQAPAQQPQQQQQFQQQPQQPQAAPQQQGGGMGGISDNDIALLSLINPKAAEGLINVKRTQNENPYNKEMGKKAADNMDTYQRSHEGTNSVMSALDELEKINPHTPYGQYGSAGLQASLANLPNANSLPAVNYDRWNRLSSINVQKGLQSMRGLGQLRIPEMQINQAINDISVEKKPEVRAQAIQDLRNMLKNNVNELGNVATGQNTQPTSYSSSAAGTPKVIRFDSMGRRMQ